MKLKSWFTKVVGSWQGPQLTIVAPRVTRKEWKYMRPKSWFLDRSDLECDEFSHCSVMPRWQFLQVVASWRFVSCRKRGGGVYAERTSARATRSRKTEMWAGVMPKGRKMVGSLPRVLPGNQRGRPG